MRHAWRAVLLGLWLLALPAAARAQDAPAVGHIDVLVTDRGGDYLPQTPVIVSDGAVVRRGVTGPDGRFVLADLPIDRTYTIRAELQGFETETREFVRPATGAALPHVLSMRLGCGITWCPVVTEPSLDGLRQDGVAVVVVRVEGSSAPGAISDDLGCWSATWMDMTVRQVVSGREASLAPGTTVRVSVASRTATPGDYLVALRYVRSMGHFIWSGELFEPIVDGRVDAPTSAMPFKDGTPIATATAKLRKALRSGRSR